MPTLLAFHSNPKIKSKYLRRVRAHRRADQIIHGIYWTNAKGCAVGCTVHSSDHSAYESELGIPEILARLEDGIFESLDNGLALTWPERFLDAITPGADLSLVWPRFAQWLLADPQDGVIKFTEEGTKQRKSVEKTEGLYSRWIGGNKPSLQEWSSAATYAAAAYAAATTAAAYAAYDAACAAYAAATTAAAYAAYDAACAVANAAAYDAVDAHSAACASASADVRKASRIRQSEKLLELLKSA